MNKPDYCPDWFDLRNYSVCAKFTAYEWWWQINHRQQHLSEFVLQTSWLVDEQQDLLREREIFLAEGNELEVLDIDEALSIANKTIEQEKEKFLREIIARSKKEYLIQFSGADFSKSDAMQRKRQESRPHSVTSATLADAFRPVVEYCHENEADKASVIALLAEDAEAPSLSHRSIFLGRAPSYADAPLSSHWGLVTVDINAPDEVIIQDFKIWLKKQRAETNSAHKKKYGVSLDELQKWHLSRILAYKDLTDYVTATGATLTCEQMGNLLFPHETTVDIAERVRKILPKTYKFAARKVKHFMMGYS